MIKLDNSGQSLLPFNSFPLLLPLHCSDGLVLSARCQADVGFGRHLICIGRQPHMWETRHRPDVSMSVGLLSGRFWVWSAFSWQPDIGQMSAYLSVRRRAGVVFGSAFGRHLVGNPTLGRRPIRRPAVGPILDLSGIWSATQHRSDISIFVCPLSGWYRVWSAFGWHAFISMLKALQAKRNWAAGYCRHMPPTPVIDPMSAY